MAATARPGPRTTAWMALAGSLAFLVVLGLEPRGAGLIPCPIYQLLHVLCPGCGATRALSALLHGQGAEALRENALFVGLLPVFLAYGGACLRRAVRREETVWPKVPAGWVRAGLVLAVVFTLWRNLRVG